MDFLSVIFTEHLRPKNRTLGSLKPEQLVLTFFVLVALFAIDFFPVMCYNDSVIG